MIFKFWTDKTIKDISQDIYIEFYIFFNAKYEYEIHLSSLSVVKKINFEKEKCKFCWAFLMYCNKSSFSILRN